MQSNISLLVDQTAWNVGGNSLVSTWIAHSESSIRMGRVGNRGYLRAINLDGTTSSERGTEEYRGKRGRRGQKRGAKARGRVTEDLW